jgi:hypothetical protein
VTGVVLVAHWLFSMSQMDFAGVLMSMAASPWACVNLVFLFLLVVLPGAKARADRPFHPLPRWLRRTLRLLALLALLFWAWMVVFAWPASVQRSLSAVVQGDGWLLVTPALFAVVIWTCRPRALWHTSIAAKHFAIGRYAVLLDEATHTVVVWAEARRIGQYDARELAVHWALRGRFSFPCIGLWWDSPAAASHHQCIFSVPFVSKKARMTAHALEAALQQQGDAPVLSAR